MSRSMSPEPDGRLYRAVLLVNSTRHAYGPYSTAGAARAAITRESDYWRVYYNATVVACVESTSVQWNTETN